MDPYIVAQELKGSEWTSLCSDTARHHRGIEADWEIAELVELTKHFAEQLKCFIVCTIILAVDRS